MKAVISTMDICKYIDHTLLNPAATEDNIRRLCEEAKAFGFKSVCVNPSRVKLAAELLQGTDVLTCCVAGFPLGASVTAAKMFEALGAINRGAREIDMVMNIGAAKEGRWDEVEKDIASIVNAVKDAAKNNADGTDAVVKVIIETCLLNDMEKLRACECAMAAGADYVKTSTGFSTGGATVHDVRLMRSVVGNALGVKASGGIRTYSDAMALIEAGATRLGTSSGVAIALEARENLN